MDMISFIMSLNYPAAVVEEPEPEPEVLDLTLGATITYTGAQSWFTWLSGRSTERLFTPRMLYHNGKTYDLYQAEQIDYYGQLKMMVFDKQAGFDRPVTVGPIVPLSPIGTPDTHTVGSLKISVDPADGIEKLYATQEITHLVPLDVYKGLNGDHSIFNYAFQIGLNLAYANIIDGLGGHPAIWSRGGDIAGEANHLYSCYITESTNGFEGLDTATPRRITERPAIGLWHYPGIPFGNYKVGDTYHLMVTLRTGQADGGLITNEANSAFYWLLTDDFITFRNFFGTFSHDTSVSGLLTDAILQTNFMYYQTDAVDVQGRSPVAGLSATRFAAIIVGNHTNDGTYRFLYFKNGAVVDKPISIPNMEVVPTENQTGPFSYMMIRSETDITIVVAIDDTVNIRPHFFHSSDLGDSWQDMGDIFSDIPGVSPALRLPNNILQIPNNENFYIAGASEDTSDTAFYYGKLAAWGTIQPIPGLTITPAASMNYNSTGLFHYRCDNDNLTKTGTNVTAFIDLFGLRNATAVNNPQWNSVDNTVAFTSAGSQQLQYSSLAGLLSQTAFTFMFVGKFGAAAFTAICFSNNTDTDRWVEVRVQGDGLILVRVNNNTTPSAGVNSQDAIHDGNFHCVWVECDGQQGTKIFIDGKLQFFQTTLTGTSTIWGNLGKGPAFITGVNAVRTNLMDLSSADVFTNGTVAEMAMWSGVMPIVESRARMYKLCQDHGITYQSQFAIPS